MADATSATTEPAASLACAATTAFSRTTIEPQTTMPNRHVNRSSAKLALHSGTNSGSEAGGDGAPQSGWLTALVESLQRFLLSAGVSSVTARITTHPAPNSTKNASENGLFEKPSGNQIA